MQVVVSLGGGVALVASGATPAQAVSCGSTPSHDWQAFDWTHQNSNGVDDVEGVRAGILFRLDGSLCDSSPLSEHATSIWIAVVGTASGNIVQMGFDNHYNTLGFAVNCFFWAIQGGSPQEYHCTGMSDGDEENFYIHTWNNNTQYILADCGTNTKDYSNCTVKSSSQAVWDHPSAQNAEEENYGACDAHTFGDQSNPEKIGALTGKVLPLQGFATSDKNWDPRSWGKQGDTYGCTSPPYVYYLKEANPSRGLDWYDNRNAN